MDDNYGSAISMPMKFGFAFNAATTPQIVAFATSRPYNDKIPLAPHWCIDASSA